MTLLNTILLYLDWEFLRAFKNVIFLEIILIKWKIQKLADRSAINSSV